MGQGFLSLGLYICHVLGEKYGKEKIGLYHDDGLACFKNINGLSRINRKGLFSIFKMEFKLSVTGETNLKIMNF